MSDEPEDMTLRLLRRIDERQARFEDALRDFRAELRAIKSYIGGLVTDQTTIAHRLEDIEAWRSRINRRLDLVDSDPDPSQ
jgi:hypothetical protein